MKNISRSSILGVTLLEIMLVLAIAAMIIVMSVRYYQTAQTSSQANAFMNQINAITGAVENLAVGGNYGAVNVADLTNMLPTGALTAVPWGAGATFALTANGYTFTYPAAASTLCNIITPKFAALNKYTFTCTTITYNSSK